MKMAAALAETLAMVAPAAAAGRDAWWIIGSAAVALHGAAVPMVNDVDLLMSAHDAEAFLRRVGEVPRRGGANRRFRSKVFGIWTKPPTPVEAFGGFEVFADGEWREVALSTREQVTVGDARIYLPSADELIRLLHLFGRPKDLERARLLGT